MVKVKEPRVVWPNPLEFLGPFPDGRKTVEIAVDGIWWVYREATELEVFRARVEGAYLLASSDGTPWIPVRKVVRNG